MIVFKTVLKILNKLKGMLILYTIVLLLITVLNQTTENNVTNFEETKPSILVINNDTGSTISNGLEEYITEHSKEVSVNKTNQDAIKTPNEVPAKFPIIANNITNPKFVPKLTFKANTKNIINNATPIKLTKYAPIAELKTITLFLVGDTAILFPLLLIFAKHPFIAVIPIIPPYIHAIAITV